MLLVNEFNQYADKDKHTNVNSNCYTDTDKDKHANANCHTCCTNANERLNKFACCPKQSGCDEPLKNRDCTLVV
jgi:hypothetical protein